MSMTIFITGENIFMAYDRNKDHRIVVDLPIVLHGFVLKYLSALKRKSGEDMSLSEFVRKAIKHYVRGFEK
jgi:hypothetical protein